MTINIDGKDVETNGRVIRTCDKYNVSAEINRARARNRKALIIVKADKEASFGIMQDVMKTMQENHLERFLIITDPETDAEES